MERNCIAGGTIRIIINILIEEHRSIIVKEALSIKTCILPASLN